jgi:DNA-binding transcriptional regulator YiaG
MGKQIDPTRTTVKTNPGKPGRPALEITARDIRQIEQFAGYGMTRGEIAHLIGITKRQLTRWQEKPEVLTAIERGRAKSLSVVGKKLFEMARDGDTTAIIWFEKTRGRRSDRIQVVNEDEAATIQRQLSSMTTEQLERVANGESPIDVLGIQS